MRRLIVLACLAGLLAVPSAANAITGGQPDGNAHPYVGLMVRVTPNGLQPACSGSLISPTVFVTAAHCATDGEVVGVTVDAQAGPRSSFVPGVFHRYEGFCEACEGGLVGFAHGDVAVVELFGPIAVSRYAELPAPGAAASADAVTLVGYGVQQFIRGGGPPQGVSNFARTTTTASLGTAGRKLADEFVKVKLNKGGFCFGDSGGPVLVDHTIVAVNSFLTNDNCAGVGYSYRLDTADALSFIGRYHR